MCDTETDTHPRQTMQMLLTDLCLVPLSGYIDKHSINIMDENCYALRALRVTRLFYFTEKLNLVVYQKINYSPHRKSTKMVQIFIDLPLCRQDVASKNTIGPPSHRGSCK